MNRHRAKSMAGVVPNEGCGWETKSGREQHQASATPTSQAHAGSTAVCCTLGRRGRGGCEDCLDGDGDGGGAGVEAILEHLFERARGPVDHLARRDPIHHLLLERLDGPHPEVEEPWRENQGEKRPNIPRSWVPYV